MLECGRRVVKTGQRIGFYISGYIVGLTMPGLGEASKIRMNKFSTKKLLNSKWTAVKPVHKEKHFTVTEVEYLESGAIDSILLEAIISKRAVQVNWRDLKDTGQWKQGWK